MAVAAGSIEDCATGCIVFPSSSIEFWLSTLYWVFNVFPETGFDTVFPVSRPIPLRVLRSTADLVFSATEVLSLK